jgi:hypothetical protein
VGLFIESPIMMKTVLGEFKPFAAELTASGNVGPRGLSNDINIVTAELPD